MSELLAIKMKQTAEAYEPKKSSPYSPKAIANKWTRYRINRKFLKEKEKCISIIERAAKEGKRKAYVYIDNIKRPFDREETYLRVNEWDRAKLREILIDEGFKVTDFPPETIFEGEMSRDCRHGPFGKYYHQCFFQLFVWIVEF